MFFLIGIYSVCKNTGCKTFNDLVNSNQFEPKHVQHIIDILSTDTAFEDMLDGELYQFLLSIQLFEYPLKK